MLLLVLGIRVMLDVCKLVPLVLVLRVAGGQASGSGSTGGSGPAGDPLRGNGDGLGGNGGGFGNAAPGPECDPRTTSAWRMRVF